MAITAATILTCLWEGLARDGGSGSVRNAVMVCEKQFIEGLVRATQSYIIPSFLSGMPSSRRWAGISKNYLGGR